MAAHDFDKKNVKLANSSSIASCYIKIIVCNYAETPLTLTSATSSSGFFPERNTPDEHQYIKISATMSTACKEHISMN